MQIGDRGCHGARAPAGATGTNKPTTGRTFQIGVAVQLRVAAVAMSDTMTGGTGTTSRSERLTFTPKKMLMAKGYIFFQRMKCFLPSIRSRLNPARNTSALNSAIRASTTTNTDSSPLFTLSISLSGITTIATREWLPIQNRRLFRNSQGMAASYA